MTVVREPNLAPDEGATRAEPVIQTSAALVGDGEDIAQARHLAAGFLARVQADYGLPVSQRAMDLTQLVVSELVTNARKYAPGPVLLDLRIVDGLVEVVVWDSDPILPVARAADAGRVGQHGLEIVMALARASKRSVSRSANVSARLALADDPGGAVAGHRPL